MTATKAADRLGPYRKKRDFARTPEPSGSAPPEADGHRFVVQRHRARRLHYDLRLELDGVLVSWAVPKGPTLDPDVRRMAVHVEDHPLGYFDFEGVIPAGEYGGGDVIVWDWGTWTPDPATDPHDALERGNLHFDLDGEKLAGRFVLVRRGRRGQQGRTGGKDQWLLLHKHDDHAIEGWDPEEHDTSVKTGRTNQQVAASRDAVVWTADDADHAPGDDEPAWLVPDVEPVTEDELAALDDLGAAGMWTFAGHELKLTNLDKVLFPANDTGPAVTKRDLIRYHAQLAPHLLPYLEGRPVNMRRFPNGITKAGFWHKEAPDHAPAWITRWDNPDADPGETQTYVVLDHPAALAWAANFGAIELNPWTSRASDPQRPTWALIDIDPGTATSFEDVVALARLYRVALEHLGVQGCPKVTGKRGIQIWVPIEPGCTFAETRAWVERLSRAVGATLPDLISWRWEKDARAGKARLDYTQNAINKTLVAPFSVRPEPGAPVSVPIEWDELDDTDLMPDRWTTRTVLDRVEEVGDPLRPLIGRRQHLPRL